MSDQNFYTWLEKFKQLIRKDWIDEETGLHCLVAALRKQPDEPNSVMDMFERLGGYVEIPEGHPLFDQNFDYTVSRFAGAVHGGVTWTGPRLSPSDYWVGFDANHLWDEYDPKTVTYMANECQELARFIKNGRWGGR